MIVKRAIVQIVYLDINQKLLKKASLLSGVVRCMTGVIRPLLAWASSGTCPILCLSSGNAMAEPPTAVSITIKICHLRVQRLFAPCQLIRRVVELATKWFPFLIVTWVIYNIHSTYNSGNLLDICRGCWTRLEARLCGVRAIPNSDMHNTFYY